MAYGMESLNADAMIGALGQIQQQMKGMQERSSGLEAMAGAEGASRRIDEQGLSVNNAQAVQETAGAPTADDSVGKFADMLKSAFENVNALQNESSSMQQRFDLGDRSITLADVMLASQKSSISFEATLQIRNKMVSAYQSIFQMQI